MNKNIYERLSPQVCWLHVISIPTACAVGDLSCRVACLLPCFMNTTVNYLWACTCVGKLNCASQNIQEKTFFFSEMMKCDRGNSFWMWWPLYSHVPGFGPHVKAQSWSSMGPFCILYKHSGKTVQSANPRKLFTGNYCIFLKPNLKEKVKALRRDLWGFYAPKKMTLACPTVKPCISRGWEASVYTTFMLSHYILWGDL